MSELTSLAAAFCCCCCCCWFWELAARSRWLKKWSGGPPPPAAPAALRLLAFRSEREWLNDDDVRPAELSVAIAPARTEGWFAWCGTSIM